MWTRASLVVQWVKNLPAMQETWVWSLGWEDSLEKGKATYSSILAWKIPWTEEPGGLQFMGSQRVRHNWVTKRYRLVWECEALGGCNVGKDSQPLWSFSSKKPTWLSHEGWGKFRDTGCRRGMTGTAETPQSLFFLTEQSVLSAGGCTLPEATLPSLSLQVSFGEIKTGT